MGRKSKIEILTEKVLANLKTIKGKVSGQTYNALERKLYQSMRTDVINNINKNIDEIKSSDIKNFTVKKIKNLRVKKTLIKESKEFERKVKTKDGFKTRVEKIKYYTKYDFQYDNINDELGLYKAIKFQMRGDLTDATSATVYFNTIGGDKKIGRSIYKDRLDSYEKFKTTYDSFTSTESGDRVGSDAISLTDMEPDYNFFSISIAKPDTVRGSTDKNLFQVEGVEQTKRKVGNKEIGNGDCGKQCLKFLVKDNYVLDLINKTNSKEFNTIDKLRNFITDGDLDIAIVCNSFLLKRGVMEIVNKNGKKEIEAFDQKGKYKRKWVGSNLTFNDIELVYLCGDENSKGKILYDEFNSHFDVIKNNEIKFCDNVYLTVSAKIIKEDKVIFGVREININNKAKYDTELRYIFFDYETVIDYEFKSCMREYSLSILDLNDKQLEELTKADEDGDTEKVKKIRKDNCITFLGYDCSTKFIDWIIENQSDKAFVFIGFNNVNFDNFILLNALLNYNKTELGITDIFYNGNQLLNFYLNGRHNTFDIHKHLMGSLKDNCESFKIKCCAKKSFDHHKAQLLYDDGELINFIKDNDELIEYNEYDVLATAVLFCKYRNALKNIDATNKFANKLHEHKTIGSLVYKVFEESKKNKNFNLPKLSYEEYTDLQKSKIAGRVELFNGVQKVVERLVSTDVCSLYPYVMSVAPVYYPCGEKIDTDKYQGSDVIGFYYCDIDQSNLKASNLPNIYAKKSAIENDWGYNGILENYLISNVMIELLLKYNCKVVIKNGFYFTEKKKSCDMFDFLLDFMSAKNGEDTKKKNKDESYNPALRETLKLLMNSLSGKVIEGLHTEKVSEVNTYAEYEKLKSKVKNINAINAIGDRIFLTYDVDGETIIHKQRPIYLGVLIYDYAKRYMYEYSYSKVGLKQLLYTDTDASKFRYSKFIEWKQWVDDNNIQVPHWKEVEEKDERYINHKIYDCNSKVFGSFEDELEEMVGNDYVFYCVEKKSWCYGVDGKCFTPDGKSKYRFKGLNVSALLLSLGEGFVNARTINHKATLEKDSWTETKYFIKENNEKIVNDFNNNNKHLSIDNNTLKFYEQIYKTKEAYILCNSFRKIVKNSARNVVVGEKERYNNLMNRIQVNYIIKKINIKK